MKTNSNDPIYPHKHLNVNSQIDVQYKGLTMREYFAAMAMQGLLSKPTHSAEELAIDAIKCADALINELNNPE